MKNWKKITEKKVIPLTKYVLRHMNQHDGRPEMEAFCETIGMLFENAYLVEVVAPEYFTFSTDILEKNMPTWEKRRFRTSIQQQVKDSRDY